MARTISGELTLPDGSPLANAAIHFTAKRTEAVRILEDVSSFFTTSSTGAYSQDVEPGYYAVSVSYAAVPGTQPRRWHLGDVWVEDGDPISLTALLALNNSAADPTDSALRQLLADAQAARDEAQAAAQEAEQYRDETASMLDSKIDESEKGEPGGVATLDSGGRVPAGQLPSYVDDVEEYADYAALPRPAETGKIYITLDTNRQYRWGGSDYIELVASPGTTDNVPEGSSNLYHTAARVRAVALAGISFASSAAITASDTILSAFGKIQAKLNTLKGMAFLDKATQAQAEAGESDEAGMTPRRTRQLLESRAVGLSEGAIAVKEPGTPNRGNAFSIGDGGGTSGWFKVCQVDTTGLSNVDNAFSLTVLGRRVSFDLDFHLRTGSDGASPTMPFFRITKANRGNVGEEVCIVQADNIFTLYVHYRISGWENAAVFVKSVSDRLGLFSQRTTWFTGVREDPVDGVFPEVVGPVLESASPEFRVGEGKVTPESIDNWNTAYGWGDHASAGYYSPDNVGTPGKNLLAASTQEAAREAIGFDSVSPATPANGGLLVDNQKTGTGLERVLTESDLTAHPGVSEFDVFVVYGQSNALGEALNTEGYPSNADDEFCLYWNGSALLPIEQNMPSASGDVSSGHAWASFANKYFAETGRGVILIPCAKGATSISQLSKGQTYYSSMVSSYNSFTASNTLPVLNSGVLFLQGETDQRDGTTFSQYSSLLQDLHADIKADLGIDNMFMAVVGNPRNRPQSSWDIIQSAQEYCASKVQGIQLMFREFGAFNRDLGLLRPDGVHCTQRGYNLLGYHCAKSVAEFFESGSVATKETLGGFGLIQAPKDQRWNFQSCAIRIAPDGTVTEQERSSFATMVIDDGAFKVQFQSEDTKVLYSNFEYFFTDPTIDAILSQNVSLSKNEVNACAVNMTASFSVSSAGTVVNTHGLSSQVLGLISVTRPEAGVYNVTHPRIQAAPIVIESNIGEGSLGEAVYINVTSNTSFVVANKSKTDFSFAVTLPHARIPAESLRAIGIRYSGVFANGVD